MSTDRQRTPLLAEWACLGILYPEPAHGWAIARRLRPDGDIGRVWSVSRPLTYRALDQLTARGDVASVGEEPGDAAPNRTILAATRRGRDHFRRWVRTPVEHLRELRSELLLKLVLADRCDIDIADMLAIQREHIVHLAAALADEAGVRSERPSDDVVARWRYESSQAAVRFLDGVTSITR